MATNFDFLTDFYQTNFLCVFKNVDFEYTIIMCVGPKLILRRK